MYLSGVDLKVDAFICCTGWDTEPPIRFLPEELKPMLGLKTHDDDNWNWPKRHVRRYSLVCLLCEGRRSERYP
jgi:hypothetical protein